VTAELGYQPVYGKSRRGGVVNIAIKTEVHADPAMSKLPRLSSHNIFGRA
jgi:hypothetical protein